MWLRNRDGQRMISIGMKVNGKKEAGGQSREKTNGNYSGRRTDIQPSEGCGRARRVREDAGV